MAHRSAFKKKRYAWNPENEILYNLMASKVGVVCINWVFQGILGMDRAERVFKILFDLILTILASAALSLARLPLWLPVTLGFVTAHTINWLLNTHFWVMGRYLGITHNPPSKILTYIRFLAEVAQGRAFLLGVVVFGNMTRGGVVRPDSDIDVRYVREKGLANAVRANLFSLREKIRALFLKMPLDSYICDELSSLDRLRKEERPIILYDPHGVLKEKYQSRGYDLVDDMQV